MGCRPHEGRRFPGPHLEDRAAGGGRGLQHLDVAQFAAQHLRRLGEIVHDVGPAHRRGGAREDLQRRLEGGKRVLDEFGIAGLAVQFVQHEAEPVLKDRPLPREQRLGDWAERGAISVGGGAQGIGVVAGLGQGLQGDPEVALRRRPFDGVFVLGNVLEGRLIGLCRHLIKVQGTVQGTDRGGGVAHADLDRRPLAFGEIERQSVVNRQGGVEGLDQAQALALAPRRCGGKAGGNKNLRDLGAEAGRQHEACAGPEVTGPVLLLGQRGNEPEGQRRAGLRCLAPDQQIGIGLEQPFPPLGRRLQQLVAGVADEAQFNGLVKAARREAALLVHGLYDMTGVDALDVLGEGGDAHVDALGKRPPPLAHQAVQQQAQFRGPGAGNVRPPHPRHLSQDIVRRARPGGGSDSLETARWRFGLALPECLLRSCQREPRHSPNRDAPQFRRVQRHVARHRRSGQ